MACHRTGLSRFAPPRSIWGANTLLQLLNDDLGTSARTTPNQAKITVPCLKKKKITVDVSVFIPIHWRDVSLPLACAFQGESLWE